MYDTVTNIPKPSVVYNGQSLFLQVGGTGSLLVGQSRTLRLLGFLTGGRYDREGRVTAALRTVSRGSETLP